MCPMPILHHSKPRDNCPFPWDASPGPSPSVQVHLPPVSPSFSTQGLLPLGLCGTCLLETRKRLPSASTAYCLRALPDHHLLRWPSPRHSAQPQAPPAMLPDPPTPSASPLCPLTHCDSPKTEQTLLGQKGPGMLPTRRDHLKKGLAQKQALITCGTKG